MMEMFKEKIKNLKKLYKTRLWFRLFVWGSIISPLFFGFLFLFIDKLIPNSILCIGDDYNYCKRILEEFEKQKLEQKNISEKYFEELLKEKFNLTLQQIRQLAENFKIYAKTEYDKGLAESSLNNYEKALVHFNAAINLDPENPNFYYSKAIALYFLQKYEDALTAIEASIDLKKDNNNYWAIKGRILDDMGRWDESIIAYNESLKLNPNDIGALNDMGIPLGKLGRYHDAISFFDKALSLEPNCVVCLVDKGIALLWLGEYKEAVQTYSQVLNFDSNNIQAFDNRGHAYYKLGEYEKALKDAKRALELSPYVCRYMNVGIYLMKLNKTPEANSYFKTAENLDPNYLTTCQVVPNV